MDDVVHQYAVVDTKRLRDIDSWYMDTGTDRAQKFAHRRKPTNFKVGEGRFGDFEDWKGDTRVQLGPLKTNF